MSQAELLYRIGKAFENEGQVISSIKIVGDSRITVTTLNGVVRVAELTSDDDGFLYFGDTWPVEPLADVIVDTNSALRICED